MKMTLDFAIQHCHDDIKALRKQRECSCADEHEQLAGWLEELKALRAANEPLMLEQLQKGDVVWIKDLFIGEIECLRFDRIDPATYHSGDDYRFEQFGTDVGIIRWACKYGINWLAYRRPPERSENDAKV